MLQQSGDTGLPEGWYRKGKEIVEWWDVLQFRHNRGKTANLWSHGESIFRDRTLVLLSKQPPGKTSTFPSQLLGDEKYCNYTNKRYNYSLQWGNVECQRKQHDVRNAGSRWEGSTMLLYQESAELRTSRKNLSVLGHLDRYLASIADMEFARVCRSCCDPVLSVTWRRVKMPW